MNPWIRIKKWWRGTHIPVHNDPDDLLIVIGPGRWERPWVARVWVWSTKAVRAHWEQIAFITSVLATTATLIVTLIK